MLNWFDEVGAATVLDLLAKWPSLEQLQKAQRKTLEAVMASGEITGAALERRFEKLMTKKVRKQLRQIRDLRRRMGQEEPPSFDTNIYDVCCTGLHLTELSDDDVPF